MAKYEIEIRDELCDYANGLLTLRTDSMGNVFARILNAKKITEPKPSYSRQQVLCEEWLPLYDASNPSGYNWIAEDHFCIFPNNSIHFHEAYIHGCRPLKAPGCAYAPTKDLAEEIVSIREEKWRWKKGDIIWWHFCGVQSKITTSDYNELLYSDIPAFPSEKQLIAFIEKNKPKEKYINFCSSKDSHGVAPEPISVEDAIAAAQKIQASNRTCGNGGIAHRIKPKEEFSLKDVTINIQARTHEDLDIKKISLLEWIGIGNSSIKILGEIYSDENGFLKIH